MRKLIAVAVMFSLPAADAAAQVAAAPSLGGTLVQTFLALIGVVALLVGCLWLLKNFATQRATAAGLLRVVAAAAVGGRERVVIVEVGSTWLVLGVAPGRVAALAEIPRQPVPAPPPGSSAAAVPRWLDKLRHGR